ncbi:uncharacterized protein LOC111044510 isoform X1 [Nilaparvata lugens]|uniref:uncharacterized protein LOC111044510 isoform X1 n=1 Tax=Nilaparvata lugens TaxID=108931 RepID=UPI00193D74EB|nr:uncharacterized protein LOC111044510 isoform X1 [Nilaparvata lugens]
MSQSCLINFSLLKQCIRVMPLKIFVWCCVLLQIAAALTGDNVCRRVETSSETVQYVIQEPVTYRLYTWCLKMPPRCSKYSTIMKERIKSKIQINNNTIEECCEGHVELSGICVTECNSTECPNMLCKTEDSLVKCKCRSGFMGYKCNKPCLYGFWGDGCFDKCECNGESCDAATGDCLKTTTTTSQTSETPPTTNSGQSPKTNIPTSTLSEQKTSVSKTDKNDYTQDVYPDLSLDPTGMPPAVSQQEDFPATLLPAPEDEIILLYPSSRAQTPGGLQKIRDNIASLSVSSTTESSIFTSDSIPRPPKSEDTLEKLDDVVRHTLFTKDSEFGSKNENDLTEKFHIKSTTDHGPNQSTSRFPFNINPNTDSTTHSSNQKHKYSDDWDKMGEKRYQNKNDNDFDNNLQISNGATNYTDFKNGLNTNEIQKDMGARNSEEKLSSSDMTINSSLVKAKRQRGAFDLLDFNSLLILLSLAATIILSFILIIVSVVRCNRLKAEASVTYDDTVNCDNSIRTGHYSTPGQPIFFCPAFSNSYAIELAQELREAQYDHPKSSCCLNEPLYAELKY